MKTEKDGFKVIENGDDFYESLYTLNDNIILLHEQIKELQRKIKAQEFEILLETKKAGD